MSEQPGGRHDPTFPNTTIVAKREFLERVKSRPYAGSTVLLSLLAMFVAFMPVIIRLVDRDTTTTIAVVAQDDELATRSAEVMKGVLAATSGTAPSSWKFVVESDRPKVEGEIADGRVGGAVIVTREASGKLDFTILTGADLGADRAQILSAAALGIAIVEWTSKGGTSSVPFFIPGTEVVAGAGPNVGGTPLGAAQIASRQLLGTVLVVILFLTMVIYGMWVAAGVAAEKETRVMELLISAASARQLVLGKVLGIGLAGLLQYATILVPAILALALERPIGEALGLGSGLTPPLEGISAALFLAYGAFFVLGFTLYALIYAAAGSLVSRVEDLQVIALPMSLLGIAGYLQAVLALSGGLSTFMRISSFVPFWSPFVMFTRLTVGRVQPWELVLAYGLLVLAIGLVAALAIRVYSAGVLLYGQRPGPGRILRAVLSPDS
jgi:ABC-2 type transport system permease protein